MKQGKSLVELATALEEIQKTAKDYVIPTEKIRMNETNQLVFQNGEGKEQKLDPTGYAHGQIAGYAGVPKQYYDKLLIENPALLTKNVNHGLDGQSKELGRGGRPENRMIRTVGGKVRAMLSASYRRLDSYDLANTVLPVLLQHKFQVVSAEITETRFYLKALTPKVTAEVKPGDLVQFGLMISNSDVGAGTFRVEPLVYRLVCANGMICDTAIKKFHLGKNLAGDDVQELLSQKTLQMTDAAFFAQVKDLVIASMEPQMFESQVNRLREAAKQPIKNFDIPEVVELSMKAIGVDGENVKQNIIQYLANGADGAGLTKWGLANGFTYAAQQEDVSYDDSIHLERAGAKIIDLHPNQWKRISDVDVHQVQKKSGKK